MKPGRSTRICGGRISRSGEPPLSRAARGLPGVRARVLPASAENASTSARNAEAIARSGPAAARRKDPRGEGTRRISPGVRCPKSRGGRGFARAQVSQGKAIRPHGAGSRRGARAGRAFPSREALLTSIARPIVLAPPRMTSRSRPGQQRTGRDAALHSVAPSALCCRRSRSAGHDQRQPLERADRLRR